MTTDNAPAETPVATIVPPINGNATPAAVVPPVTPAAPAMTREEKLAMIAQLSADSDDEADKLLDKILATAKKDAERREKAAADKAMGEKRGLFGETLKANALDALTALGIVIPEKGMKLAFTFDFQRATDGGIMATVTEATKAVRTATTGGTRAPRTTGGTSDDRPVLSNLGITKMVYKGAEMKNASALAEALGQKKEGDSAPRYMAAWARQHRDEANEVIVTINGTEAFLGDVVAEKWPATASEAEATPAPATA